MKLVNIRVGSNSTFAYLSQSAIEQALASRKWQIERYIQSEHGPIVVLSKLTTLA